MCGAFVRAAGGAECEWTDGLVNLRHSVSPLRSTRAQALWRVKSSEAVVIAHNGPVLGLGKPPKHQGEARSRLNTCASRAGARRAARGDPKDVS